MDGSQLVAQRHALVAQLVRAVLAEHGTFRRAAASTSASTFAATPAASTSAAFADPASASAYAASHRTHGGSGGVGERGEGERRAQRRGVGHRSACA